MDFKEWLKLAELNLGGLNGNRVSQGPQRDRRFSPYGQTKTDQMPNPFNQGVAGVAQGLGNIMMQRLYPKGNQPGFGAEFPSILAAISDSIESADTEEGREITGSSQLIPVNPDKKDDLLSMQRNTRKLIIEQMIRDLTAGGHQKDLNLNNYSEQNAWMENNLLYVKVLFRWNNPEDHKNNW
jgi:hypothetical protein